jgi:hypothetical protein
MPQPEALKRSKTASGAGQDERTKAPPGSRPVVFLAMEAQRI